MELLQPVARCMPDVPTGSEVHGMLVTRMHDSLSGEAPGYNDSLLSKLEGYIIQAVLTGSVEMGHIKWRVADQSGYGADLSDELFVEAWNKVHASITQAVALYAAVA